jgi:hypothetical protein
MLQPCPPSQQPADKEIQEETLFDSLLAQLQFGFALRHVIRVICVDCPRHLNAIFVDHKYF